MSAQNIFEQIKNGLDASTILAITDQDGIITYANDAFCRISKFSQEELIGRSHRIINSGHHPKSYFKEMWATISSGKIWKGEICNKAKDGSIYWTHATIIPLKDNDENITQYLALRYEITAQKEQEFSVTLLSKLQKVLFDKQREPQLIPDAICKLLLKETRSEWVFLGTLSNINDKEKPELIIPKIWLRQEDPNGGLPTLTPILDEFRVSDNSNLFGWSMNISQPFILQNGAGLNIDLPSTLNNLPLRNYLGFPLLSGRTKIGFLGIANSQIDWVSSRFFGFTPVLTAITQVLLNSMHEAEKTDFYQKLQMREKQLTNFIDSLTISVAVIDRKYNILSLSKELIKTFDWINEDHTNQNLWTLLNEAPSEWKTLIDGALAGKTLKSGEEQYFTRLGRTIWIEWTVRPWYKGDEVGGAVITFNDLTEQKDLYREIEQMRYKELLTSKMASLGEIAGGVAHEINNPLTIISGVAEQLSRFADSDRLTPELIKRQAERIQHTTDRIATIIKGLKAFARDGEQDAFTSYSLNQIIRDSLPYFEPKLKKGNIEWRCTPDRDYQIECRPIQISQVLVNLVANACDAIQSFEDRWISLEIVEESKGVRILVTDSGKGIPKLIAEKIMEPFFTTKDIGKGTGLGLSISKSIVEAHSGLFFLDENHPNTRFVIRLPFNQDERLTIQNGREAIALHLAWKQRLLDSIQTLKANNLSAQSDPLLEWIKDVPNIYGTGPLTDSLMETHQFLSEQITIIFELLQAGKKDFAISELLHSHSTYNSLSKVLVSNIINLEQRLGFKKQKAA